MSEGSGYLKGIVTGVIVGAAAAVLLTPRRGAELRHDLAEGATKLKERGQELAEQARARGEEVAADAAEHLVDARGAVTDSIGEAKEHAGATIEKLKDKAHDVIERA